MIAYKRSIALLKIMAVTHFPAKQIGPIMSECLVTGFHSEDEAVLLAIMNLDALNGTRLV